MTTEPIIESEMSFGPYPEGHCFYIEESKTYRNVKAGMKMAEFLLLHSSSPPVIWIIEAKQSSPQPTTKQKFKDFIKDIREKLANALALYMAICLQRHPLTGNELPEPFQNLDLKHVDFRLILIIRGHEKSWLPPLQEALNKALKPTVAAWNLSAPSVLVLNDEQAQKQTRLICKIL